MPNSLYETIDNLIAGENKPAEYCFDEAWISHLEANGSLEEGFPEINDVIHRKGSKYRSIAVACAAFEISKRDESIPDKPNSWLGYASDRGNVQKSMYDRLMSEVNTCKSCESSKPKHENYSEDLMTNFGYTFKIIFKLIKELDTSGVVDLGWNAYSGSSAPSYSSFCSGGFRLFEEFVSEHYSKEGPKLMEALNTFARCSSMLGNYCCIPTQLDPIGVSGLNIMKGGVGVSLFVYDDRRNKYRVNDQFALFVEWLDENAAEEDQKTIERWKEKMLLEKTWGAYKEAASAYKNIFKRSTRAGRIGAICDYLFQVSEAIENRSREIVNELKPQGK